MYIVADILMDEMMFKALFLIDEKFVASLQVVIIWLSLCTKKSTYIDSCESIISVTMEKGWSILMREEDTLASFVLNKAFLLGYQCSKLYKRIFNF